MYSWDKPLRECRSQLCTKQSSGWIGHISAVLETRKPLSESHLPSMAMPQRSEQRWPWQEGSEGWTVRWGLGNDGSEHLTGKGEGKTGNLNIPGINCYLPRRTETQVTWRFPLIPQVHSSCLRACFQRDCLKATMLSSLLGVTFRIPPPPQLPTRVPGSSYASDLPSSPVKFMPIGCCA